MLSYVAESDMVKALDFSSELNGRGREEGRGTRKDVESSAERFSRPLRQLL